MMKTSSRRRFMIVTGAILLCAGGVPVFGLTPTQSATPPPTPTTVVCALAPSPASADPGTPITLAGECSRILYHRTVYIYFDHTLVAAFDATGPSYSATFLVPPRTAAGEHTITLQNGLIGFGELTTAFEVTGQPLPCSGDCNLDDRVEINELVTGVNIAVGVRDPSTCSAFDVDANDAVAVNELVMAVGAAVRGCDPEPGCHDARECEFSGRCLSPGEHRGCGICQRYEACEDDQACDDDSVCAQAKPEACPCEPMTICQPRCVSDGECAEGEVCNDEGRCRPQPCGPAPCPTFFRCQPIDGIGDACVRRSCSFDAECNGGAGFCVNYRCYEELGFCALPVP